MGMNWVSIEIIRRIRVMSGKGILMLNKYVWKFYNEMF